jgi:hypothetical protein
MPGGRQVGEHSPHVVRAGLDADVGGLRTNRHHVPFAIKVLTIQDGLIAAIAGFVYPGLFDHFGLPPHLPVDGPGLSPGRT